MYVLSPKSRREVKVFVALWFFALALMGNTALARPLKLVVLGDSLVAGYNLPSGDAFPEQLQWRLNKEGIEVVVINAGVSGDTSSAGLARLDWAVQKGTDAVIVELGANDALRGVDPAQTYKNLDRLIARLKKRRIKILLAGMEAPRNLGPRYVRAFGKIYPDLARKYQIQLYPFFLEGIALQRRFLLADGLHPNVRGVAKIVENILPHVEQLLARK